MGYYKMPRFAKQIFISEMMFFGCNALNAITLNTVPLKFVSMSNQECRIRAEIMNIKGNEPSFYPYSVKINKCSGSCNNINDPYTKICVSGVV